MQQKILHLLSYPLVDKNAHRITPLPTEKKIHNLSLLEIHGLVMIVKAG